MSKHIKYVSAVPASEADGLVVRVYDQMQRDLGLTPEPLTLHTPAPEVFAGVWSAFRESLLAGKARRGVKETVAATISDLNRCPWCVDAHTTVLHATGDHDVVRAITQNGHDGELDATMEPIVAWAKATRPPNAERLASPPFSPDEMPELIGTAVTFHFLNRMVNVLLSETFLPANRWVQTAIKRVAGLLYSRSARQSYPAGDSLTLLPDTPLPEDLAWAEPNVAVAGAFARFAAALEAAGTRALPAEVRAVVQRRIEDWAGEDPGLSRHWVEEAIAGLDEEAQPAARLALLTALASHQVDEATVTAFRQREPADKALIGALAWASFAAARRIGTWLSSPISASA